LELTLSIMGVVITTAALVYAIKTRPGKFWLQPLGLARSDGFSARELRLIRRLMEAHLAAILETWYEHGG